MRINLGRVFCQKGEFEKSIDALDEAIRLERDLKPACHNRAWAEFRYHLRQKCPIEPQAVRDIEKVIKDNIKAETQSAKAYYDAALIHSRVREEDREFDRKRVVDYLCHAFRLGYNPRAVRARLKEFLPEGDVEKKLAPIVPAAPRDEHVDLLTDPLPNQRFPYR